VVAESIIFRWKFVLNMNRRTEILSYGGQFFCVVRPGKKTASKTRKNSLQ
jgi:hypothetical protein